MNDLAFQIRADIETKGEFINDLIKKVVDAAYVDIEDVLKFVDWLDGELSTLVSFWKIIYWWPNDSLATIDKVNMYANSFLCEIAVLCV